MNAFRRFDFDGREIVVEFYEEDGGFNFDIVSGEVESEREMDEIIMTGRMIDYEG
jgi:hypothetical protein